MKIFLWLWIGQLLSQIGSELTAFTLGIWVYQQTQSVSIFALLLGINIFPVIFLSPIIGTVVDRYPRRQVMIWSDIGAGLSTIVLAIALAFQFTSIPLIAVLILCNAVFSSFMSPAFISATSELVSEAQLDRASGLNQTSNSVAQLVAPILGGALLPFIGLPGIITIDLATFLFAVGTQVFISQPRGLNPTERKRQALEGLVTKTDAHSKDEPKPVESPLNPSDDKGFKVALNYLLQRPGLLALLGFFIIKNFISAIIYVATTPYVLSFASEFELGTILSAGGIGMVVGGVIVSLLPAKRNRIQTIAAFSCLNGLTLIVLGWQSEIWSFMMGAFLFYLGIPLIHGSGQVLFQKQVPENLHGRVFALNEALAGAAVPLGYIVSGPLSDFIFNPLLSPNGALASSVGTFLGVGQGRGIALMFIVLGVFHSFLSLVFQVFSPLRHLDKSAMSNPNRSSSSLSITMENSQLNAMATPIEASNPVIEIKGLNHFFGKGNLAKQVLFDIDLSIYPGEIIILTGPSGSGKTTLLTLIGALRSIQDGSLKILDQELKKASSRRLVSVRRKIGYIFQGHNLLPFMTARQNVRMSLALKRHRSRKKALAKVDEILTKVGLGDRLNYYPKDLSGGQKQRVAIARALVNEAQLILADEPTASLDSKTGRDVVQLMYKLAKEQGSTIVLVTHDNRILDIADRIIHLEDGRLSNNPMPFNSLSPSGSEQSSLPVPAMSKELVSAGSQTLRPADIVNPGNHLPHQSWSPYKIVCIDDSITVLSSLRAFLDNDIFSLILISDPVQALLEIAKVKPDMVILDINMPGLDGVQLCTLLRAHENFKTIPVIAITGSPEYADPELMQKAGIDDLLLKPFDQCDITTKIFPYLSC